MGLLTLRHFLEYANIIKRRGSFEAGWLFMIELVLLLTLPESSSSCEPAFSTLKIAKSFLRNTMGQTRLNDLVKM